MSEHAVTWEEPPPANSGRGPYVGLWERRLAPLRERPKQWARIETFTVSLQANTTASNLRKWAKRHGERWEFVVRKLDDGAGGLYARYLGLEETV